MSPLIAGLGTTELLIIFGVIVLLFGASKLSELARGSGRALRIFKAETKGLMDDDDDETKDAARPTGEIAPPTPVAPPTDVAPVESETARRDPA